MATSWTFELDLLKELFNIGIGRSADTLSRMVDDEVLFQISDAKLLSPEQPATHHTPEELSSFTVQLAFHYQIDFGNHSIPTMVTLLASPERVNRLIARLYGEATNTHELDEPSRDVYRTVMDLFVSTCMGSVSDLLGVTVRQERICFENHDLGAQGLACPASNNCLCLEIAYTMPNIELEGQLHLLFDAALLPDLTERYQTILARAEG
ncbi:hypothetical protein [Magnetococcus sp. PR-3]|uniref:hypothetical protein n=1 Tax=Magnetococcus sp. PR-3 TaxID=3120355 RepID=UPI002FCE2FC7